MAITKTPRLDQTRWSSGQDVVKREDFDEDAASLEANAALFKEGPLSARPAAGVNGRFYTVKDDSNTAYNGRQYYDNGTEWKAVSYTNNQTAESIGTGDTALTVVSQPSATADVFRVRSSAGDNLFRVTSAGYSTNEATPGATGGVRFGYNSGHDQSGLFVSVDAAKPVITVKGAANQTGNLLEFRTSNNAVLTTINSDGGANFTGPITATNITATNSITAPTITTTGPASFVDARVTAGATSHVALTVSAVTGQSTNLLETYNASGTRSARFIHDGTFATDARVLIGGAQGNSGVQTYPTTTAALTVQNSIGATTPVLNLYSNPAGQTAKLVQGYDVNGVLRYWVDPAGNMSLSNNIDTGTLSIGAGSNTSPTPYYNSTTPKFEVVTGTASGSYSEGVTLRHANNNTTATSRQVSLRMKLSGETNQTESNKWAGVSARSTLASAASPSLVFYSAGTEAGSFDGSHNLNVNGNVSLTAGSQLTFPNGASDRIYLNSDTSTGVIGQQSARTMFIRSDQFAIYSGGTYNSTGLNAGGGTTVASFNADRAQVRKLTITTPASYDATSPSLQIGTVGHMQFSNYSINVYDDADNNVPAELNLCNNSGRLRLGNTSSTVSLPSRILWVGNIDDQGAANAILFARSSAGSFNDWVGRSPQNGDWWFDHTLNRINVHDGNEWKHFDVTN